MKVITLLNAKGGIGKSTLATYLAVGLALKDYRVLFIDSTPQADSTSVFGLEEEPGFLSIILQGSSWQDVIRQVPNDVWGVSDGSLYAVPSNELISSSLNRINMETILGFRSKMKQLESLFDYVIFDTQPNLSQTHDAVLFVCDYVIVPTQPENFSALRAVSATINKIQHINDLGKQAGLSLAQVIGIQPNMVRDVSLHRSIIKALSKDYPALVWDSINERVAIPESQLAHQFLYQAAPHLKATGELWRFVDNTLKAIEVTA